MLGWGFYNAFFEYVGLDLALTLTIFLSLHLYRKYKLHQENQRVVRQEQMEMFLKVFSGDLKKDRFVVEQVFENKFGCGLSYGEINYFLKFSNPTELLSKYIKGRSYFDFKVDSKYPRIKQSLNSKLFRFAVSSKNVVGYFLSAFLGFICIVYSYHSMLDSGPLAFVTICLFGGYLVFVALLFLEQNVKYSAAFFVGEYVRHREKSGQNWVY